MTARLHGAVLVLFLLALVAQGVATLLDLSPPSRDPAFECVFWILASACTVTGLHRRLPLQQALGAAAWVGGLAWLVELASLRFSIPFGPRAFLGSLGASPPNTVPAVIPCVWIVMVLNARGVARLILRPWRKTTYYGFWVLGLASVLVGLFAVAMEPFASLTKRYWATGGTRVPTSVLGIDGLVFLSRSVVAACLLGFATPWLIHKQPVKQSPDLHPWILWVLIHGLLILDSLRHELWTLAVLAGGMLGFVSLCALRGAYWVRAEMALETDRN
ncbi:MAG: carotenoid biosynthesis protein [Verrucomicrobia bacterium]|nr:carotenoid biosynthesis protein [Verrucomicrobiota bacterium]